MFRGGIMGNFFYGKKGYPRYRKSKKLVHRAVAEKKVGRPLRSHEVVHHRDGDKGNFRKSNLRVTSRSYHSKLHARKRKRRGFGW